MAGFVELYIDQGTTFNSIINLTDDTTNAAINVAGYTVKGQLRRSYYSANASGNLTCAITDAANGEITLFMGKANTSVLKAGRYFFDIITTDEANTTTRVLEGTIHVTPRVSLE